MPEPDAITMTTQPLWGSREHLLNWRRNNAVLLNGSLVMLLGTVLVAVINFGYNVVVAQMLGPADFGHASVAVTLLMIVSSITLSFQLVCAKFVARSQADASKAAVYRRLMRLAWLVGLGLGALLIVTSGLVARFLQLPSAWLIVVLAVGFAFYVPVGVKRGGFQGTCAFPRLSSNLVLETLVRFAAAVVIILLARYDVSVSAWTSRLLGSAAGANAAVIGAVAAISLGVVAAYYIPRTAAVLRSAPGDHVAAGAREGIQAIVFFVGQVIITNIDLILVKHYFPPREAGLYAAVTLVGRVLYIACWSVTSTMFPISASDAVVAKDRPSKHVLRLPIFFVIGLTLGSVAVLELFAPMILRLVFGAGFTEAKSLLSLYAAVTGIYALSVVLMAYEMSRRIANTGWLQLLFSGAIVLAIALFHDSLREVILVQVVPRVLLLGAVSLPFLRGRHMAGGTLEEAA